MKVRLINRESFVKVRYENFLLKRKRLDGLLGRGNYILTDLDRDYGDGLMKDIVICDACNENIPEPSFVMLEDEKVYHIKCTEFVPQLPKNVLPFVKIKAKPDDPE